MMELILIIAIGLGIVALFIVAFTREHSPDEIRDGSTPPLGTKDFSVSTRARIDGRVYPQDPPVGGDHGAAWLDCGPYTVPIPCEEAVHDLEHGVVWITSQPDLPMDQVATLDSLAEETYVRVSPYSGLRAPAVASS